MILIALGGNIASALGAPPATFASALSAFGRGGVRVLAQSRVYVSPAWPRGEGPSFYNQAVSVETGLMPGALLAFLLKVEAAHGRLRRETWGPRTLDLDIVDYHGLVTDTDFLALPHPWVEERAFVLKPVLDIAPQWRHPVTGRTAVEALASLDAAEAAACTPLIPA